MIFQVFMSRCFTSFLHWAEVRINSEDLDATLPTGVLPNGSSGHGAPNSGRGCTFDPEIDVMEVTKLVASDVVGVLDSQFNYVIQDIVESSLPPQWSGVKFKIVQVQDTLGVNPTPKWAGVKFKTTPIAAQIVDMFARHLTWGIMEKFTGRPVK